MSAKFDRVQGFKFYYGNAAKDLNQYLPKEESTMDIAADQSLKTQVHNEMLLLNHLVEKIDSNLEKIEASKRHLSFLLQDLKRIIG